MISTGRRARQSKNSCTQGNHLACNLRLWTSALSRGQEKYGERFGKALWRNEVLDLDKLDLDDDFDLFRLELQGLKQ